MTLFIDFLAHTRSKYFDYAWIQGLEDQSFENELGKFILSWLGNTQLDSLPPVNVFFIFKGRCVLLWGRRSEDRRDEANRKIFERALYVWDAKEGLRYSHLAPLLEDLETEAENVFASVPQDAVRASRNVTRLELDPGKLDQAAQKNLERLPGWSLPFDLTVQELAKGCLTVEVPSEWSFAKMLMPLGNTVINAAEAVCLGLSLTFKHRGELAGGWVISGTTSDNGDLPRVRDANGNLMDRGSMERMRTGWAEEAARMARNKQRPDPAEKKPAPPPPPPPPPQGDSEVSPQEFSEAAHLSQQLAPQEQGLFRRSSNDGIPACIRRLHLLVLPAGRQAGLDVLISWQGLLQEILMCHKIASPGIANEWLRRLDFLQRLVTQVGRYQDWGTEFHSVCSQLRGLLEDVRYRSR